VAVRGSTAVVVTERMNSKVVGAALATHAGQFAEQRGF
jgi:hypothetical protein